MPQPTPGTIANISPDPTFAPTTVLVAGAAGFIGSHLSDLLLAEGWNVVGLDNFSSAYDPRIKRQNIAAHVRHPSYRLVEADVSNLDELNQLASDDVQVVVHLAARSEPASAV